MFGKYAPLVSVYRLCSLDLREFYYQLFHCSTTFLTLVCSDTSTLYPKPPPNYLAASVHSLLLSTLLQPSAVFLAIWYIVRLPVYFGATELSAEHAKETRFRIALFGTGNDREAMEASAPFRLIVLGCMLANKWLDDHTFSNKTWYGN